MKRLADVGAFWMLLALTCIHVQDSDVHHGVDALEDSELEVRDSFPKLQERTTISKLIYETASLESGFILEYPKEFTLHVHAVLSCNLDLGKDIEVEEEHEAEEDENSTLVQDEEEDDQMDSHRMSVTLTKLKSQVTLMRKMRKPKVRKDFRQGAVDSSIKIMKALSKRGAIEVLCGLDYADNIHSSDLWLMKKLKFRRNYKDNKVFEFVPMEEFITCRGICRAD